MKYNFKSRKQGNMKRRLRKGKQREEGRKRKGEKEG